MTARLMWLSLGLVLGFVFAGFVEVFSEEDPLDPLYFAR